MNYPTEEMIETGLSHYDDYPNHYHTRRHALMMMSAMDFVFNEEDDRDDLMIGPPTWSRKDRMLLKTAALFHDAGYVPGDPENEGRAVEIAMDEVIPRGWMPGECNDLEILILSTQPFELDNFVKARPDLEQHMYLLHDLDWIGFASYDLMMENEKRILGEACDRLSIRDFDEVLDRQVAFYRKIAELSEDPDSVIGRGFYRYWKYRDRSGRALANIEMRIGEIEVDRTADSLTRKADK